jgi:hypothetical protein
MDFHYLSQAPVVNDEILQEEIGAALKEFHDHKAVILEAGAHRGKKKAIDHFNIPKLELFQTMKASIHSNSANIQWLADITEHAHIMEIKEPAELGNNQNYEDQICQYLDRLDKIHSFELAMLVCSGIGPVSQHLQQLVDSAFVNDPDIDAGQRESSSTSSPNIGDDTQEQPESSCDIINYFQEAAVLVCGEHLTVLRLFHTFSAGTSAFHLNHDASYKLMTIDSIAETFGLLDL